jgi:hypothetical protein
VSSRKIEGVSAVQARVEMSLTTSELRQWREKAIARRNPPTVHKGTVAERMVELARMAGVQPEELQTMTVVEFAARVADMRARAIEATQ